jgi:hypothetical protein
MAVVLQLATRYINDQSNCLQIEAMLWDDKHIPFLSVTPNMCQVETQNYKWCSWELHGIVEKFADSSKYSREKLCSALLPSQVNLVLSLTLLASQTL